MASDENERTIYIKNLDEKVTEKILEELFIQVGRVESVNINSVAGRRSQSSAPPKADISGGPEKAAEESTSGEKPETSAASASKNFDRYAFVRFHDEDSVLYACEMMDCVPLFGRKIRVWPRDKSIQAMVYKQMDMERVIREKYLGQPSQSPNGSQLFISPKPLQQVQPVPSQFFQNTPPPVAGPPVTFLGTKYVGTPRPNQPPPPLHQFSAPPPRINNYAASRPPYHLSQPYNNHQTPLAPYDRQFVPPPPPLFSLTQVQPMNLSHMPPFSIPPPPQQPRNNPTGSNKPHDFLNLTK